MNLRILNNYSFKIFILILISLIIDNFYINKIYLPPAWDQGYHLSNVFKMYNIFEDSTVVLWDKLEELLKVTTSYRGPLTYFISALFLKITNNSYHFAYLSNTIFNSICIISIFNIGKLIKNSKAGLLASLIFSFSSLILKQRSDYLIDLSLTSFSTLNLFFLTKWYLDKTRNSLFSFFSGISLGLVFLTKPTSIIFFLFSLLTILIKKFRNKSNYFFTIKEIIFFIFAFIVTIFPWFSINWLTIITTTINAWNWGINYQDGFDSNSLENWLFYFKGLPSIIGYLNFSIFSVLFLFEIVSIKNNLRLGFENIKQKHLWFFIYFLNFYLILSLMSTKDIRFILPLYPLICIYLSIFITSKKYRFITANNRSYIIIISIFLSIFLSNRSPISRNISIEPTFIWPQSEIINEIKKNNPNLISTLAVLPDTREINTFNLESEAAKQGEYVSVRQVISNENTYKEDLKYFDWFLVKTGDQGIMSTKSKNLLNKYLLEQGSFLIHKKWILPDSSELYLLRREKLNTLLSKKDCENNSPNIQIKQINNGINIQIFGEGESIKNSNLLIDLLGKNIQKSLNISIANGSFQTNFDKEKCYFLSQNLSFDLPQIKSGMFDLKARLLKDNGEIEPIIYKNNEFIYDTKLTKTKDINMTNKIAKVELLGSYLKRGEFKNLFDLVGIINQSDPNQKYLANSEKIYKQRYKENKNLKDLYSILISQILQRRIKEADKTIKIILESDSSNGNSYLAKSIINLYLLNSKEARSSLNQTKLLKKSDESIEIIKTVDGIISLLELKFINAYKIFT